MGMVDVELHMGYVVVAGERCLLTCHSRLALANILFLSSDYDGSGYANLFHIDHAQLEFCCRAKDGLCAEDRRRRRQEG